MGSHPGGCRPVARCLRGSVGQAGRCEDGKGGRRAGVQQTLPQALQWRHHTTASAHEDTRHSPPRTCGGGQLRGRQAGALPLAILPEAVPHHEVQVAWGRGEAGWSVGGGGQLVTRRKLEGGNLWGQLFNPQATNPSSAAIRLRCILESTQMWDHTFGGRPDLPAAAVPGRAAGHAPAAASSWQCRAPKTSPPASRAGAAHSQAGERGQASRRVRFLMWLYRQHSHSSS